MHVGDIEAIKIGNYVVGSFRGDCCAASASRHRKKIISD